MRLGSGNPPRNPVSGILHPVLQRSKGAACENAPQAKQTGLMCQILTKNGPNSP
jgi:hypothetical protein